MRRRAAAQHAVTQPRRRAAQRRGGGSGGGGCVDARPATLQRPGRAPPLAPLPLAEFMPVADDNAAEQASKYDTGHSHPGGAGCEV